MSQIAVRLTDEEVRRLDAAVSEGGFGTRARAVRTALDLLDQTLRERRIAESYRSAYTAVPLSDDEAAALDAALASAGEALR